MSRYSIRRYDDRVVLSTPYDAEFVSGIKAIPSYFRSYEPDAKTWTVRKPRDDAAVVLTLRYFPDLYVEDMRSGYHQAPPPGSSTGPHSSSPHAALYVTPDAPRFVIDAAYRALAKTLHPDTNGPDGSERMRRVNAAYERLKRQVTL